MLKPNCVGLQELFGVVDHSLKNKQTNKKTHVSTLPISKRKSNMIHTILPGQRVSSVFFIVLLFHNQIWGTLNMKHNEAFSCAIAHWIYTF